MEISTRICCISWPNIAECAPYRFKIAYISLCTEQDSAYFCIQVPIVTWKGSSLGFLRIMRTTVLKATEILETNVERQRARMLGIHKIQSILAKLCQSYISLNYSSLTLCKMHDFHQFPIHPSSAFIRVDWD